MVLFSASTIGENNKTHVFDFATHSIVVPRWEVSQNLGAVQTFPEKCVVLEEEKNQN